MENTMLQRNKGRMEEMKNNIKRIIAYYFSYIPSLWVFVFILWVFGSVSRMEVNFVMCFSYL